MLGIMLLGAFLRFNGLGDNPLWIDEVTLAFWVRDGGEMQEFIYIWITRLIGTDEFSLRLLSAICGTLTIPAIYYVTRNLWATGFVAVFPLFVFWSKMARPYAMIGLFIVLGWRWWWFYLPAIFTSPMALLGVRLNRIFLGMALFAVVMFFLRPDYDRGFHLGMFLNHSRLWYVPVLAGVLYITTYFQRIRELSTKALDVVLERS